MPSLAVARATNTAFSTRGLLGYRPTALFVGGTSGVGEGSAIAFSKAAKGNAHIILCGRNRASAERIIHSELFTTPESKYEFVECDATLMSSIVKACAEVKARIGGRLNYLVQSQGIMTLDGFTPTSEGIDRKLALHFYGKWKFIDELMPCLESAASAGQDARVMNIFAPHHGEVLDRSDLGLKRNFTLKRAANQPATWNNLMIKEYSLGRPSISFIHIAPGAVETPLLTRDMPWYIKALAPAAKLITKSKEDCGEWMVSALTSPNLRNGGHYLTEHADAVSASKIHVDDDEDRRVLVEHWTEATRTI